MSDYHGYYDYTPTNDEVNRLAQEIHENVGCELLEDCINQFTEACAYGDSTIGMPEIASQLNLLHLKGYHKLANEIREQWFNKFTLSYARDFLIADGRPEYWSER